MVHLVMTPAQLQDYLHDNIPLTGVMELKVESCGPDGVHLSAPIAPNINHRQTLFGGSATAIAILSAWSLVHLRLRAECLPFLRIVIQRNTMNWTAPIPGDVHARCESPDQATWDLLMKALRRKGRGRIMLHSTLFSDGTPAAEFQGTFVAMDQRA
jgi:thioesterase domain-containing protein